MKRELFICSCDNIESQIIFSWFVSDQDVSVELLAKIKECKQKINDAYMEMQHQQVASIVASFVPLDPLSPVR